MGHQSYVVVYKTEEEKESALAAVKLHNAEPDWDIRGETIVQICDARYGDIKIVLFGNGGGRQATFTYLDNLLKKDGLETQNFDDWYSMRGQPDEVPSFIDSNGVWKMNPNNTAENRAEAARNKAL